MVLRKETCLILLIANFKYRCREPRMIASFGRLRFWTPPKNELCRLVHLQYTLDRDIKRVTSLIVTELAPAIEVCKTGGLIHTRPVGSTWNKIGLEAVALKISVHQGSHETIGVTSGRSHVQHVYFTEEKTICQNVFQSWGHGDFKS